MSTVLLLVTSSLRVVTGCSRHRWSTSGENPLFHICYEWAFVCAQGFRRLFEDLKALRVHDSLWRLHRPDQINATSRRALARGHHMFDKCLELETTLLFRRFMHKSTIGCVQWKLPDGVEPKHETGGGEDLCRPRRFLSWNPLQVIEPVKSADYFFCLLLWPEQSSSIPWTWSYSWIFTLYIRFMESVKTLSCIHRNIKHLSVRSVLILWKWFS